MSGQVEQKSDDKKKRRNKNHLFTKTYDTKQTLAPKQIQCLDAIAHFYNHHKRKYNKVGVYNEKTRKQYVQNARFEDSNGIHQSMSYRFFRGIMQDVVGLHQSIQSNRENYLIDKLDRLESVNEEIIKLKQKYENLIKNQAKVFNHEFKNDKDKLLKVIRAKYKKRQYLLNAIENLRDVTNYNLCFGTKKLMKQRHRIKTKKALTLWKKEWHLKRNGQFLMVGSWDETNGNSNCQVIYHNKTKQFSLRLRIPYELESSYGEYLTFENIAIPNYLKAPLIHELNKHQAKSSNKNALSFRFIKLNDSQYRIIFTLNQDNVDIVTHSNKGVIGVDVNADHFAVVEINKIGAIQNSFSIPYHLEGKTKHQRKAIIEDGLKQIRDYALKRKKDVVIEKLNFKQKRQQLYKNVNKKYARMLSAFAYQQIQQGLMQLQYEYGIKVHPVPAAYTSLLGQTVAADKSLTIHQAAAWFIAKRFYKIKELIKQKFKIYHRSKPFMVYIPREIYREHNLSKLGRFLSDVRNYIGGSLSLKKRQSLKDFVVPFNDTTAISS